MQEAQTAPVPELESITLSVFVVGVDTVGRSVDGVIDKDNHTITFTLPEGVVKNSDDTVLALMECSPEALLIEADEAGYFELDYKQDQVLTLGGVEYSVTVQEAEIFNPFSGSGTAEDPYIISDATVLGWLSERYNTVPSAFSCKYWKQTENIDMSNVAFVPIGNTYDNRFVGLFDGNGYRISNLHINYSEDSTGLFGYIGEGTIIENVTLDSTCSVESSASGVGSIVGTMSKDEVSRVENCTNYATIISDYGNEGGFTNISGSVGGIVGSAAQPKGFIIGCYNYGNISLSVAGFNNAGGIVGNANSTSVIDCHNYGNVTAPSAESWSGAGNGSSAGGITAYSAGVIAGCCNTGTVSGGYNIGGIVGQAGQGMVEGCYNIGTVKGNSGTVNPCSIGGIVGNFSGSYLGDCYNAGTVTTLSGVPVLYAGSIAGQAPSTVTKAITNNYFIGAEESEAFGAVYLETAEAVPLTATELKSEATVAALNDYPEPWSLYKTTWAADSGNANNGYPIILSVVAIPSFYAELTRFSVTVDGNTYAGTIDGTEVSIVLPYGTATVAPKVTVSDKATVTPADGESVDLSAGPVTYTVTAESGKKVDYTVKATIPQSLSGLTALRVFTSNLDVLSADAFSQSTLSYSVTMEDAEIVLIKDVISGCFISAIPAETGATMTAFLNDGTIKTIRAVTSLENNGGSLNLWGPSLAEPMHPGENTVTLTVTPPSGGSGAETTYTLKLTVVPTLATLSLTDADSAAALTLTPAFDPDVLSYTLDIPEGTENLQISAEAYLPNIEDVILPENCVEGKLPVSGEGLDIQVGKGENVTTYHIAYASLPGYKAIVTLDPADAVISITDPNGNYVRPEADGSYKLTVGYTYSYTAAKVGYATVTDSFTHDSTADFTLTVTLSEVSGGPSVLDSDWPDLRGNAQNLGVTDALTARSREEAELLWAAALGTGYTAAPSVPILVDGQLIVMSGSKLLKLSLEDGSILQSADMVKTIDWGYTPATYADGMIFAPLTDGTVQAFDAETLESLWVYSDPLGGQSVSPIYYYEGYVYTGFWNSELHDAAYVCLPATDEDPDSTNEAKAALWRDVHTGGFYWAGAVAVGDYLVYGSDDGVREGQNGTATLYSRNRITGVLCDTAELVGDQRSSIAYADGKLYFTTKKGNLYQASLNADGSFAPLKVYQMGGMATGTPVVYDGLVFASSLDGTDQFGDPGATYVLDAADLSLITTASNKFYNQSSLLLSTAYADEGKLYLYGTYNGVPGGMEVLVYDTSAKTLTVSDFFIPDSDKQQYGICSPICDANGIIYYKNDSAYIFAIANKNADALAAAEVDGLIDAIGTVSLESKGKIDAARAAYDALNDKQKELVTKLAVLLAAEAAYEDLAAAAAQEALDAAAAKGVDDQISAIGTVTLESESAIKAARAAYNALTDAQKALVTKLDTLEAAEAEFAELKAAADKEAADKEAAAGVDTLIDAIGEVTLDSKALIESARKSYDALTEEQQALVTKLAALEAAEAKYAELKAAADKEAADKEAAADTDALIDAIGEVTLESKALIEAARKSYDALTKDQQALVTKLATLEAAEEKYAELAAAATQEEIDEAAAKGVDKQIDAIGTVTMESESAVKAARKSYDALTKDQQALVKNLAALEAAEAELAELKAAADKEAADKEAAADVDKLIDAIGEVTLESKALIESARKSYDALTKDQQALVTKLAVLEAAEAKYAELKAAADKEAADKEAAADVDALIDAIGEVSLESKAKIDAARKAYDALTKEQKALVKDLADLEAAEAKYQELADAENQKKIDEAAAKGVDDMISAIGEVTLDSETAINAARAAYDKLTDAQKALVKNLATLTAAEAKLEELKKDAATLATVTFHLQRGQSDEVKDGGTKTYTGADKGKDLPTAKREGYSFQGWFDQPEGGTKYTIVSADLPKDLYAQWKSNSSGGGSSSEDNTITVTFRLIGARQAEKDVDLGKEEYLPDYVTWIATTTYKLDEGATVYDLWVKATGDAGVRSIGAEKNYISTVYAPSSLGGYELSEFTNGKRSGWMYTINGKHPGFGLKEQELKDGDKVVWHYVNDYSYEVSDWFDEPMWPSLGDGRYYNRWLKAPDRFGGSGGGLGEGAQSGSSGGGSGSSGGSSELTPSYDGDTVLLPAEIDRSEGGMAYSADATLKKETVTEGLKNAEDKSKLKLWVEIEESNGLVLKITPDAAKELADAGAGLRMECNRGVIEIDAEDVAKLAESGKEVRFAISYDDWNDKTRVSVTVEHKVADVSMKIELPATDQSLALAVVNSDGTRTVIKKSAVIDDRIYAEITGSATVQCVGNTRYLEDVKSDDWFAGAVNFVMSHELMNGVGKYEFAPNDPMTRAMLVTVLYRLEDEPEITGSLDSFGDVDPESWYAEAVAWASETELVNGTDRGFEPNANISREQIATILFRYAKHIGLDTSVSGDLSAFGDGADVSPWAKEAMAWAVSVGLFKGDENGDLNPGGDATRAEVATLLERLIKLIVVS